MKEVRKFYWYHVIWYSNLSDRELHEEGIISATNYLDAFTQLLEVFNEDLVSIRRLEEIGELLSRETIDSINWDTVSTEN